MKKGIISDVHLYNSREYELIFPERCRNFPVHDCNDIRNISYEIGVDYSIERCMICERVVGFRWDSFWRRLRSIF